MNINWEIFDLYFAGFPLVILALSKFAISVIRRKYYLKKENAGHCEYTFIGKSKLIPVIYKTGISLNFASAAILFFYLLFVVFPLSRR